MAKKWAIVVGINQYKRLQPLRHAAHDAQAMRDFLVQDARFDQVYYFTDRSPEIVIDGISIATQPTAANLRRFLTLRFAAPFLKQGDTLWFFFSGYGLQYANADYLMPIDADPETAEATAISIDTVADRLSLSGTDNIVLFLDACRTDEQKFGQGFGTDPKGVVCLFSTAFGETTSEIEALKLGSFTYALLEGLHLCATRDSGATIAQLMTYLHDRLPQVNLSYGQPAQSPRLSPNAPIAPEAMLLPQVVAQAAVSDRQAPAPATAAPKALNSYIHPVIDFLARPSNKFLQAGIASIATLVVGFVGINAYRVLEPFFTTPRRWDELWAETLARTTPSPSSSPTKLNPKNNVYQRLPRPGIYYATVATFSQSAREISSANGRFCIKLINAPSANPLSANRPGESQVIVSSLSLREDGIYIDATREQLQVDGTFTEITDSKTTWQWAKADADRSDTVAACLASTTVYTDGVKAPVKDTKDTAKGTNTSTKK